MRVPESADGTDNLYGHVDIMYIESYKLYRRLAEEYDSGTGIPSLKRAVEDDARHRIAGLYCRIPTKVRENQRTVRIEGFLRTEEIAARIVQEDPIQTPGPAKHVTPSTANVVTRGTKRLDQLTASNWAD